MAERQNRTGAMHDARRLLREYGVSGALGLLADAAEEIADDVETKQPRSINRESASLYRMSARVIRAAARRIRHNANRVGF